MKPKLVFFGNERLATGIHTNAPILSALIDEGYKIEAVVINQSVGSRRRELLEVEQIAQANQIPLLSLDQFLSEPGKFESRAAVLAAFGRMVPQSVIDLFPLGIVNVHPSLLPRYRGSSPIEAPILNGDAETGVSLMRIVAEMDAGPVFEQQTVSLTQQEKKQDLYTTLSKLSAQTLVEILPAILAGSLAPVPQKTEGVSFTKLIDKADGAIDWRKPAQQIEREVRAYAGWPGSSARLFSRNVIITSARVIDAHGQPGETFRHEDRLAVYCGEQALLIDKLKPAGKAEMDSRAFLAGVKTSE